MPTSGSSGAVPRPNEASIGDASSGTGSSPVPKDSPELQILADLAARRPGGIPVQDVLRSLLTAMSEALDASSSVLVLTARDCGDELDPVVRSGRFERLGEPCLDSVESFLGIAARTGGLVRSGDLSQDERAAEAERRIGAGPACGRRLLAGDGAVGAVGFARDRGGDPFTEADEAVLAGFDRVFAALAGSLGLVRPREDDPPSPAERRLMNTLRHEVNNPLAVVMGQAQILRNDPGIDADPHIKQSIEAILEGSERIRDVLRALTAAGESKGRPREG
jgi:signal transduction histidine kinase